MDNHTPTTHDAARLMCQLTGSFENKSPLQKRCWEAAAETYVATMPDVPMEVSDDGSPTDDMRAIVENCQRFYVDAYLADTTTWKETCRHCGRPIYEQNDDWFHAYGTLPELIRGCRAASYQAGGTYDEKLRKTWKAEPAD